MLDKKTLFNGVYALALFGAITSCIGILNEFLNIVQLYDKRIENLLSRYNEKDFLIPFIYLLVTFILCAFTVTVLILYLTNVLKGKTVWLPNVCIIVTCVIIFVLSLTFIHQVKYIVHLSPYYSIGSFDYTTLYSFRSLVMSYIASTVTILFCNIIQSVAKKRGIEAHTYKETQA